MGVIERHQQRTGQGKDDHVRKFLKEDPGDAPDKNQRQKDRERAMVLAMIAVLTSWVPATAASAVVRASPHAAGRCSPERRWSCPPSCPPPAPVRRASSVVQREAAEVDQRERGDHGDGNRQGDHERAAHIAQEEQQHQDRQPTPVQNGTGNVGDGPFDEVALVDHRHDPDLWKGMVDRFDLFQHAPGHLHRVGIGLLAYCHPQATRPVDAHDAREFLVGVPHVGNLAKNHRGAVLCGEYRVAYLVQIRKLRRSSRG